MPNRDEPRGARPYGHLSGGDPNRGIIEYPIADAYAEELLDGDFVVQVSTGGINLAAATERLLGVFRGCRYINSSGEQVFSKRWPASTAGATERYASVACDPNSLFLIQADTDATGILEVDRGNLADIVATAGNTTMEQSRMELDTSGIGTGTAQLRIIDKDNSPDNAWGDNVNLIVQIYEHELTGADSATPGV